MGNTLKAADLYRVLTEAKTFAGRDASIPVINAVRLEATETQLVATATDRFILGASRTDYTGETFKITLDMASVDALIKMAKTVKRDASWRSVDIEFSVAGSESVPLQVLEFRFTTGEAMRVSPSTSDFPNVSRLIPSELAGNPTVGYDASKLAQFAKVEGHHAMRVYPQGDKPTVVLIGHNFLGLIMPVRIPDDGQREYARPMWMS